MPEFRRAVIASALLLASPACVGHGESEPYAGTPESTLAHPELQPRTPAPSIPWGSLRGTNLHVEMQVATPSAVADAIRTIAQELGGEVIGLSADQTSGSVTVGLEPDRVERFRHALSRLPSTIVRENSGTNDMTQAVTQADERLTKLDRAEAEMDRLMRVTTDRDAFEAWVVQRELNTRERDMLRSNITSYLQQVRRSQVTVTLARPAEAGGHEQPPLRMGKFRHGEEG